MLCLHGKPAVKGTTHKGTLWFCAEPSSCHFVCLEDHRFLYDKAIKEFLATKQDRPMCCGVTPEASADRNYARMLVAMGITRANFGRPFFVCSKEHNRCGFFEWGDEIIITKPLCEHGKPCKLREVKKEGCNQDKRLIST